MVFFALECPPVLVNNSKYYKPRLVTSMPSLVIWQWYNLQKWRSHGPGYLSSHFTQHHFKPPKCTIKFLSLDCSNLHLPRLHRAPPAWSAAAHRLTICMLAWHPATPLQFWPHHTLWLCTGCWGETTILPWYYLMLSADNKEILLEGIREQLWKLIDLRTTHWQRYRKACKKSS